ncbi:MAG: oligoendopeptidase F [Deltaproteobacteria bacterium]|nr:MAG: oligoendopeptidase F [Deltaproteobacteria bacterium]
MSKLPPRSEVPNEDKWNLEALYEKNELWEQEFEAAQAWPDKIGEWKGKLNKSAAVVADALKAMFDAYRQIHKLYVYAHLRNDEDLGNSQNQALYERARKLYYAFSTAASYISPELLSLDEDTLASWVKDPALKPYKVYMRDILRKKPHTLPQAQEQLLSMAAEPLSATNQIFSMLNNLDIPSGFGQVKDDSGEMVQLSHAMYGKLTESNVPEVRQEVFHSYMKGFQDHRNTLAAALEGRLKANIFLAKARNYGSAREAALFANQIPTSVYDGLIEAIHEHLPDFYRYVELRKRVLKMDEFHIFDMRNPIIADMDLKYEWEEAEALIVDSLQPLGQDYVQTMQEGFRQGWVDRYENQGKRSGAYSSGCYDSMPYILHNYNHTLSSVYTLTHELGHSMHSALANRTQPFPTADYCIFVAEVASTTNEALLTHHLLNKTEDPKVRAYLINKYLDDFRGTMFRQTMFAEFERDIYHALEQEHEALTADYLDAKYYELVKSYHGDAIAWDEKDKAIETEWSRIPHFYYNFYVYQYATGMAAATSLAHQILNEGQPAVQRYLNFLGGGGSDDPLVLLKNAGVDLNSPQPVRDALKVFRTYLDELEQLLDA